MSTSLDEGSYASRCRRAAAAVRCGGGRSPVRLAGKATSNLFRDRLAPRGLTLDLSEFSHVLEVNTAEQWVDVEGGATYEAIVDATLAHGVMPAVVPQLRTITAGGAAAGVGIEATSFREGLVHHTLLELHVLLASGEIVVCTPHDAHRDLFFGFPNSYGTLGYALRLRLRTQPVKPYVYVQHICHGEPAGFFARLLASCEDTACDFVDGVAFGPGEMILNAARFVDTAPARSDYGFERMYWRSLLERETDFLSARDWLWRWDTDWFWCSRNFGADHVIVRRLLGRDRLNSRTWQRLMRWNTRYGLTRRWAQLRGLYPESVIQDVDIPLAHAAEFLDFLRREIGILPVWICPLRAPSEEAFTLYPLQPRTLYVNFGFWDVVKAHEPHEAGHFNRLIEREVARLCGIKSLYSDSYYSRDEFARAYGMQAYERLKNRYDPDRRLLGLYEKCVQRA
jgi:FAD/FMN-containing dehydrogenase